MPIKHEDILELIDTWDKSQDSLLNVKTEHITEQDRENLCEDILLFEKYIVYILKQCFFELKRMRDYFYSKNCIVCSSCGLRRGDIEWAYKQIIEQLEDFLYQNALKLEFIKVISRGYLDRQTTWFSYTLKNLNETFRGGYCLEIPEEARAIFKDYKEYIILNSDFQQKPYECSICNEKMQRKYAN
jgi:hypothetical protein